MSWALPFGGRLSLDAKLQIGRALFALEAADSILCQLYHY